MAKGKERLAAPGFYVEYVTSDPDFDKPDGFGVMYIPPDILERGDCKYIHCFTTNGSSWTPLSWVCAPTKKKLELAKKAADGEICERYLYFATHEELCKFPFIHQKPGALVVP